MTFAGNFPRCSRRQCSLRLSLCVGIVLVTCLGLLGSSVISWGTLLKHKPEVDSRRSPEAKTVNSSHVVNGIKSGRYDKLKTGRNSTLFLYYTQVASCLPDYLRHADRLGDVNACRCKVLVLSYKSKCVKDKGTHISYINGAGTTWTIGRNRLYWAAKKLDDYNSYVYHTFLDGDVRFSWTHPRWLRSFPRVRSKSPLRAYEEFLLRERPPVGAMIYTPSGNTAGLKCTRPMNETGLMVVFDAAFNSFHQVALDNVLPYPERYEDRSIWNSQQAVFVRALVRYFGQCVRYHPTMVNNPYHSKYNRGLARYAELVGDEKLLAPEHLRSHPIWQFAEMVINVTHTCKYVINPRIKRQKNPSMEPYKFISSVEN